MSNNIFIFSFSRSGSTLLCNLLNNNENINLINETWLIPTVSILGWKNINYNKQKYLLYLFNKSQKNNKKQKKISANICVKKQIPINEFYKKLFNINTKLIGEKNPVNTLHIDFINDNFNNSKKIFLSRNPLSIANSYKNRWLKNQPSHYFLYRVTVLIKTYFNSYYKYISENNLKTIKYEDLICDTSKTLKNICQYLNVKYDEKMKENLNKLFLDKETKKYHQNIDKKVNTESLERYLNELPIEEIEDLKFLLRDIMSFFGYKKNKVIPTKKLLKLEKKINKRVRFNKSKTKKTLLKIKYKLYYIKYLISG